MNRREFCAYGLAGIGSLAISSEALALQYYPSPSEKKIVIVYSTWCGSARDAAVWISEGLGGMADVFDVREKPDLKTYDHIIVGGAIRGMVTSNELQEYLQKNQGGLGKKVRGLFAVCGNMRKPVGAEQTTQFIDNHLAKLCGTSKVRSKVFLGRITKSLMDAQNAKMMAGMEDYDNLKRSDCLAFGRELLEAIQAA
jgi:menaquinone-dependent protoporphyrinogen IX oxidase